MLSEYEWQKMKKRRNEEINKGRESEKSLVKRQLTFPFSYDVVVRTAIPPPPK